MPDDAKLLAPAARLLGRERVLDDLLRLRGCARLRRLHGLPPRLG